MLHDFIFIRHCRVCYSRVLESLVGRWENVCLRIIPDFAQFNPELVSGDPATLIPQLLDQLEALGDTARQLKQALGHNGDRPDKAREVIEYLRQD